MSNKIQLQANNTEYASLIEMLRGKATGGSNIGTCTVTITGLPSSMSIAYTTFNGEISGKTQASDEGNVTLTNVLCGSAITIVGFYVGWSCSDGEILGVAGNRLFYQAPKASDVVAEITLIED